MKKDELIKKEIERVSIFIDGSNFYHSIRKVLKEDERVDYQKLVNVLTNNKKLVNAFYYVARLDISVNPEKYKKHEKFLENLNKITNLKVKSCNLKKIRVNNEKFVYIVKGDDIQLAQDLLIEAFDDLHDTAIIVSGDEDFLSVINILREKFKKKVINACFRSSSSYKLRNACNFSIKLNKIISQFINKKKNNKSSSVV